MHSGQKIVQVLLKPADSPRSRNAGGEHLLDTGVPNRNQRELRGHKKSVGQNQHGNRDKFEQRKTVHLGVRIAFWGLGT